MRTFIVAGLCAVALAVAGCKNQNHDNDNDMNRDTTQHMSTTDACPHCPAVQQATVDGKCPICGGPAQKM